MVLQLMLMKPAVLTISGIFSTLHTIAKLKGQGSGQRKQALITNLISRCRWARDFASSAVVACVTSPQDVGVAPGARPQVHHHSSLRTSDGCQ